MTLRTITGGRQALKLGVEGRQLGQRGSQPPCCLVSFSLFFFPLCRRGRSLSMMNRDKEKEKRGERERKFGTPSYVIVSCDAGGGS